MLDNFIAPYDATLVAKLKQAGMVMLGKTNMDEFAMGSSNENSFYGPVKNPWNKEMTPGGSSGGSAAAVAARLTSVASGTDTGGSIRQPAALCGISGLKPTYGRVSRWGMVAFASSLDQGGILAQTAEDIALVLNTIAGYDEKDSTSVDLPAPENYSEKLNHSIKGLKIGLPKEYFHQLDSSIAEIILSAAKALEQQGASLQEIHLPNIGLSVPTYYVIAPAECSANLARYDGVRYGHRCQDPKDLLDVYERTRAEGFGAEVKRRILIGTYVLSAGYYDAYYLQAQKVRRLIMNDFNAAFEQVDVILGPTAPHNAFKLGEKAQDPVSMYLSDIYTIGVNLAGLPGISIPAGFINNLSVGLQLIGKHFDEARLLNVAHQYQQITDWHKKMPE
jgi:aspartyl-tRNA(Asn)/glutamyl-tRNA(Gln) amidotransferase subunit A